MKNSTSQQLFGRCFLKKWDWFFEMRNFLRKTEIFLVFLKILRCFSTYDLIFMSLVLTFFEKISEQKKSFFQKKFRVLALFYNFDF